MRVSQKMSAERFTNHVSVRFEKTVIYLTAFGFLSIAGIYFLFI